MPTIAAHGSWSSPLAVEEMTTGSVRIGPPRIDGGTTYWRETGADGRGVVMSARDGSYEAVTSVHADGTAVDVGSRVHEYGGPDFAVSDGVCVFSSRSDGRLWVTVRDEDGWTVPQALTADNGWRYADLVLSGHMVFAVAEVHGETVRNLLVRVDLADGEVTELRASADFVANPRLNADGGLLAWYEWDHPDMPWDSTRLLVAEVEGVGLGTPALIAQGASIVSPIWAGDDLVYVSDESGFWNLYRCEDPLGEARIRPLHPAEFDFAAPPWNFDQSVAVLDEDHLVCRWTRHGRWSLGTVRISNGESEEWITGLEVAGEVAVGDGRVAFLGTRPTAPAVLAELVLAKGSVRHLRATAPTQLDEAWVALAEALDWEVPGNDGAPPTVAHGFWYPPNNPDFEGPAGELPPLLVLVHSGPTSATSGGFAPAIQFWTTRGFGVLDVNYRGSTGYGTAYRRSLLGQWGLADIADVAAGVRHLIKSGLVDPRRVAIRGGSAGGYTALRAVTSTDVFTAAASRYGVADLALLAADTHKFESHYTDRLVGPWPEAAATYRERSPLYALDSLHAPVLLLQGEDDAVVPPNQARELAAAIKERGGDVELVLYPGEGHGFRLASTNRDALTRELHFYGRCFGFAPA